MPRKARLDAPGTLHHVIIRGIERRPIVDDEKDRENFVSRLGQLAAETEKSIGDFIIYRRHTQIDADRLVWWGSNLRLTFTAVVDQFSQIF